MSLFFFLLPSGSGQSQLRFTWKTPRLVLPFPSRDAASCGHTTLTCPSRRGGTIISTVGCHLQGDHSLRGDATTGPNVRLGAIIIRLKVLINEVS